MLSDLTLLSLWQKLIKFNISFSGEDRLKHVIPPTIKRWIIIHVVNVSRSKIDQKYQLVFRYC